MSKFRILTFDICFQVAVSKPLGVRSAPLLLCNHHQRLRCTWSVCSLQAEAELACCLIFKATVSSWCKWLSHIIAIYTHSTLNTAWHWIQHDTLHWATSLLRVDLIKPASMSVRPYVRLSAKSFSNSSEICCVGRGQIFDVCPSFFCVTWLWTWKNLARGRSRPSVLHGANVFHCIRLSLLCFYVLIHSFI